MDENNTLINGEYFSAIPVADRGFTYGDGIFRTMRVIGGVPQHWPLHYQKLSSDCASIGIVCPSAEALMDDLTELFIKDTIDNDIGVAKIIITRGEGKRGYSPPAIMEPTRVVMKLPMPQYTSDFFMEGVTLRVCDIRLSKQPKLAGIKHLNRLENVLARMEWKDEAIFDGLLLDSDDNVIECTMSNLFARFDKKLVTPKLNQTGVAGITRSQIITLAKSLSFDVEEVTLTMPQLLEADEIVICNSIFGVFQVKKIDGVEWPTQSLDANLRNVMRYDQSH